MSDLVSLLALLATPAILALFLKIYWKLSTKWNGSYKCLVGKTAIVTGANTGFPAIIFRLGYFTALDFAKRGAKVILACRNVELAENACKKITKATCNKNVVVRHLDLASLQCVRDFADNITKNEERLDILVNNAGAIFSTKEYTEDGVQSILQTNHVSPFLLTHLLIGKLKRSAPSRIINVASLTARRAKLNVNNLEKINAIPDNHQLLRNMDIYSDTKLCNILFTTELAKKLQGTNVTVNALHPGVIATDLFRSAPAWLREGFSFVGKLLLMSQEEGAQTQIYLSVSDDVEGISGGLFANCSRIGLYATARDPELARKLWEKSEELAKLRLYEKLY